MHIKSIGFKEPPYRTLRDRMIGVRFFRDFGRPPWIELLWWNL